MVMEGVALVTGASRGIGAGIAERLAAEGLAVACVARTMGEGESHLAGSLVRTVERIEADGGRAGAFVVDLAAEHFDAAELVAAIVERFGPLTHLVNNAAACTYLPFAEVPVKRIDIAYRLNVRAPWLLAQEVLPAMIERGAGSIVNISSATSEMPAGPPFADRGVGGASVYGGSKAWLERATVGAASELTGTGVSINTLAPEYAVVTEGADAMMAGLEDRTDIICEPTATMAQATVALLTGDPAVVTGQVTYSLSLLRQLGGPVYELDGQTLCAGWQPEDYPVDLLREI